MNFYPLFFRRISFRCMAGAALLFAIPVLAADRDLVVFEWSGYEDPAFFSDYVRAHGDSPTYSFFSDEEEAFNKRRAGFRADLAHPCAQSVGKWRESGFIEPFDTSRLKHWQDIAFKDTEGFVVNGDVYVVPTDWGSTGLTYRTDLVSELDASTLQSFANPGYEGRISLPDNVDDAFALAFLATGVRDWSHVTETELQAASKFLRSVHQNVRTYWADGAELSQLMASGEVLIAWAWAETATTMRAEGFSVALNRNTREGSSTWNCGYVNLKDGPGAEDKMYDFINAWLSPGSAQAFVTSRGYGHSNLAAMKALGPGVLASAGFDDLDTYRTNTLQQSPLPRGIREKMVTEFEKIKMGF